MSMRCPGPAPSRRPEAARHSRERFIVHRRIPATIRSTRAAAIAAAAASSGGPVSLRARHSKGAPARIHAGARARMRRGAEAALPRSPVARASESRFRVISASGGGRRSCYGLRLGGSRPVDLTCASRSATRRALQSRTGERDHGVAAVSTGCGPGWTHRPGRCDELPAAERGGAMQPAVRDSPSPPGAHDRLRRRLERGTGIARARIFQSGEQL